MVFINQFFASILPIVYVPLSMDCVDNIFISKMEYDKKSPVVYSGLFK